MGQGASPNWLGTELVHNDEWELGLAELACGRLSLRIYWREPAQMLPGWPGVQSVPLVLTLVEYE